MQQGLHNKRMFPRTGHAQHHIFLPPYILTPIYRTLYFFLPTKEAARVRKHRSSRASSNHLERCPRMPTSSVLRGKPPRNPPKGGHGPAVGRAGGGGGAARGAAGGAGGRPCPPRDGARHERRAAVPTATGLGLAPDVGALLALLPSPFAAVVLAGHSPFCHNPLASFFGFHAPPALSRRLDSWRPSKRSLLAMHPCRGVRPITESLSPPPPREGVH